MGRFDRLEARLHKSAARAFGYSAVWLPSVGGEAQTVTILFKDPNKKGTQAELDNVDYRDVSPIMEYHGNEFPGLREAVNTGSHEEAVTITKEGVDYYYRVAGVDKLHDGDTYYAYLVQISSL